jgi:hypothetical protein
MKMDRVACLWEEMSVDSDFDIFQYGEPIIICHHIEGNGFCDYWELSAEERDKACPFFQEMRSAPD